MEGALHPLAGTIIAIVVIRVAFYLHRRWNAVQVLVVSDVWKATELPKHEKEQAKLR
jgi:hypothetical protein